MESQQGCVWNQCIALYGIKLCLYGTTTKLCMESVHRTVWNQAFACMESQQGCVWNQCIALYGIKLLLVWNQRTALHKKSPSLFSKGRTNVRGTTQIPQMRHFKEAITSTTYNGISRIFLLNFQKISSEGKCKHPTIRHLSAVCALSVNGAWKLPASS